MEADYNKVYERALALCSEIIKNVNYLLTYLLTANLLTIYEGSGRS